MGWLEKARPAPMVPGRPAPAATLSANRRLSNGLKDFLWLLSDLEQGRLLDLGPVSQATVNFFIERNFKVYTEDLLRSWKEFLRHEEQQLRSAPVGADGAAMEPAALAERFLEANLRHPAETFNAVLAWDLCDYLDEELLTRVVKGLFELVKPGGVVLAIFHSRTPEGFHRYRVLDAQTVELVPAPPLFPPLRVMQNSEILRLFGRFRSSKTFVGRDQLREALFTR